MPSLTVGDPDLVIRTGGERRISNFLLYGLAYAELHFADVLWPDFGAEGPLRRHRELPDARAPLRSDRRAGRAAARRTPARRRAAPRRASHHAHRHLTRPHDGRAPSNLALRLRDGRGRRAASSSLLLYRRAAVGVLPAHPPGGAHRLVRALRDDAPGRPRSRRPSASLVSAAASLAVYFGHDDPRVAPHGARRRCRSSGRSSRSCASATSRPPRSARSRMGFGPLFVAVPLTLLAVDAARRSAPTGPGYVVMTLMFAWFGDTGGYFAGRFLGKHKLYEAVSPEEDGRGRDRRPRRRASSGALLGSLLVPARRFPLAHAVAARARRRRARAGRRPRRVAPQALDRRQGLRRHRPRPRRHPRPRRRAHLDDASCISTLWCAGVGR